MIDGYNSIVFYFLINNMLPFLFQFAIINMWYNGDNMGDISSLYLKHIDITLLLPLDVCCTKISIEYMYNLISWHMPVEYIACMIHMHG